MKQFYKQNRVFVILMGIVLVCLAIMLTILAKYVIKSNTNDTYGNRLDGIKDVVIKDSKINEMEQAINEMEKVQSVTVNVHGKIVYFNVDFETNATIDEAEAVAVKCLDFFEEDYKNFYDMQFLFTKSTSEESEEVFPILGSLKAGATTGISWSNNTK